MRKKGTVPALAAILVAIHLTLVIHGATRHSAVFDEVVYPTSGYAYLTTGDYRMNVEHPPFLKIWSALPWLGTGLDARATPGWLEGDEWRYGQSMIYSGGRHFALLMRARIMIAALSALLAFAVFVAARSLAGDGAAVAALALYAFDPLTIAHAGLATTDLGGACFYFLAAVTLPAAVLRGGAVPIVTSGGLAGLALASKFSNVTVFPVVGAVALLAAWLSRRWAQVLTQDGDRRRVRQSLGIEPQPSLLYLLRGALVAAVAVAVLAATYGPAGPRLYVFGLDLLRFHGEVGHPAYGFGRYGTEGWWWYFPAAWIVKTPIPILVASALGVPLALSRFRKDPVVVTALLLPAGLILAASMAFSLNLGVRHLLPMTPFLAVCGGLAAHRAWGARLPGRVGVAVLGLWLVAGTLRAHPEEMAYANEPAGGPSRLWRKLADSNVDWGQSLPALAEEVGRHPLRRLYLGYFGTADPAAHGLRYHWISSQTMVERRFDDGPDPEGKEWIAMSVTNLLDVYSDDHDLHGWLRERPFTAFPGFSIALFDITGDAEAHLRLGETAIRVGDAGSAERPLRRAVQLAPQNADARLNLARVLAERGVLEEARSLCSEALRLKPTAEAEELCARISGAPR